MFFRNTLPWSTLINWHNIFIISEMDVIYLLTDISDMLRHLGLRYNCQFIASLMLSKWQGGVGNSRRITKWSKCGRETGWFVKIDIDCFVFKKTHELVVIFSLSHHCEKMNGFGLDFGTCIAHMDICVILKKQFNSHVLYIVTIKYRFSWHVSLPLHVISNWLSFQLSRLSKLGVVDFKDCTHKSLQGYVYIFMCI